MPADRSTSLEIGLPIPHTGRLASPEFVRDFCVAAEELGFHGLWAIDHLVMPHHTDSLYTLARKPAAIADDAVSNLMAPNYEMMSTLLWVAGFTSRVKLGTGVAVLTIRNPVLNARQVATLDVYSGGRVIYGAGVGWLEEEAVAMNMPWDNRGKRCDEYIELTRAMWTAPAELMEWHGPYFDLPPMDPRPQPERDTIPILIGGHSDPALDRAARLGDGWIAAQMSPPRLLEHRDKLFAMTEEYDRDPSQLQLVAGCAISIGEGELTTAEATTAIEQIQEYQALGIDHLKLGLDAADPASAIAGLEAFSRQVLPEFA